MWRVLSYGIDINALLIHDAQVLSDAATWSAFFPREMWGWQGARERASKEGGRLTLQVDLSTLQRNAEVHENIQTLLGVPVTSSLLRGWIVSLCLMLFTWLRGLAQQFWNIEWLADRIGELEWEKLDYMNSTMSD